MKKLLVMTLLEYRERPNNRIQHTVNALRNEFDEVWLLCRAKPSAGGRLSARFRNVIPMPATIFRDEKLHVIEYNPPLNYVEGYSAGGNEENGSPWIRSVVNFLGLVREMFFIVTIGYVSLRHLRGTFQICVVETFWEGIVAIFLRKIGRVRYFIFDDNDFNPGYMRNTIRRRYETWMESRCARSADLAIAAGHLLAEYWKARTGRDFLVIPNGVDLARFRAESTLERRGLTRLVYVGTLSPSWVDLGLVLESIRMLRDEGLDLRLVVAGIGRRDYIEDLKARILRYELVDSVEFLGGVDHDRLPEILKQCDIGLAVSPENLLRRFACPLKVVEYMAMGLPVIGNKGTETERIIDRYKVGVSIDPAVENMGRALHRFIEDSDYYEQCRSNAIRGALDFDLDRLASIRRDEMVRRFFPEDGK